MNTQADVPKISVEGAMVSSDAKTAKHTSDTCACWSERDRRAARRLLKGTKTILCLDATAYAAILSMSMDVLMRGGEVNAKAVKGW